MTPPKTAAERRVAVKKAKRLGREALRKAAKKAANERQEVIDEALAPKAQRDKRLVRDGNTFRVASAIVVLWKQGQRRERTGLMPTITEQHVKASDRLARAWETSQTVTFGVSGYGQTVGGGDVGVMSMAALNSVARQHEARAEVEGAALRLGVLWPVVEDVALKGLSVVAWADKVAIEKGAAYGYLRAGLDMLVAYYQKEVVDLGELGSMRVGGAAR